MRRFRGLLTGVALGLLVLGASGYFWLAPSGPAGSGCGSAAFHPTLDQLSQPGVDACPAGWSDMEWSGLACLLLGGFLVLTCGLRALWLRRGRWA
ncbi:MAG TPA: hypothetical protein VF288_04925 [Mycobacteriales bacterium]